MIGDLPELDDFFDNSNKPEKKDGNEGLASTIDSDIYIYITKEEDKWMLADFISIAVAGIGIHVSLPIDIELSAEELNRVRIRFVRKKGAFDDILKDVPVLVRWQERDTLTGKIKLGLHFPAELKNDPVLIEILKELENKN